MAYRKDAFRRQGLRHLLTIPVSLLLALTPTIITAKPHGAAHNSDRHGEGETARLLDIYAVAFEHDLKVHAIDPHSEPREMIAEMINEINVSEAIRNDIKTEINDADSYILNSGRKRVISYKGYWERAIVPFKITTNVIGLGLKAIHRAQAMYERLTCMRFLEYNVKDHQTTNQRLGLNHPGHLIFVEDKECWSFAGNLHSKHGQKISCCEGDNECFHEIGHSMGLHHEQQSPDSARSRYIRINIENISEDGRSQYDPPAYGSFAMLGYDITSWMHYEKGMLRKGKDPTFTKLFPELREHNGYHYLLMEVSLAHECEKNYCADSKLTCHNDGYLTLVDGRCACRCVPGLDPDTGCTSVVTAATSTQAWPGGSYALLKPTAGCPDAAMAQGSRTHNSESPVSMADNYSDMIYGSVTGKKVELQFCTYKERANDAIWPAGKYCFFRKGGECPKNFYKRSIELSSDTSENKNAFYGVLPDGTYGNKLTRFETCCTENGFDSEPIFLPTGKPFVLIKNAGNCQAVRGMHAIRTSISTWYRRINLCYYKPSSMCGQVISLSKDNKDVSIASPTNVNDLDCTWYIKAPKDGKIKLNFGNYDVDCDNDKLTIGYFRPGQKPFSFCGKELERTFQSFNNTIVIRLKTNGNSKSQFSAVASLLLDEDQCYLVNDQGSSYNGNANFTRFFEPCIAWKDAIGCKYSPYNWPSHLDHKPTMLEENFCRNPDSETGEMPWCYTRVEGCERNYCDPCFHGRSYDKEDNCKLLQELGFCDQHSVTSPGPAPTERCARTCGLDVPSPPPKARDVFCAPPLPVDDADFVDNMTLNEYKVGMKVAYRCKTDAQIQASRTCLTTGEWTKLVYVCETCPVGWQKINGKCYSFFKDKTSLSEASEKCQVFNAMLAEPRTKEENDIIHSMQKGEIWLPATDEVKEGTWVWTSGGVINNYTNWAKNQPDNWYGEHCANIRTSGKWSDLHCRGNKFARVCVMSALEPSVCADQWDECPALFATNPSACTSGSYFAKSLCPYTCGTCLSGATPTCTATAPANGAVSATSLTRGQAVDVSCNQGFVLLEGSATRGCGADGRLTGTDAVCVPDCPPGWRFHQPSKACFSILQEDGAKVTQQKAATACREMGGTLPIPKTAAENAFIKEACNCRDLIWLGIDDRITEGIYMNQDGTFVTFNAWDDWEPDNMYDKEDCTIIKLNRNRWGDVSCSNNYKYVCQIPIANRKPFCKVEAPTNGQISKSTDEIEINEQITYSCDDGFVSFAGKMTRTCLINGKLTGQNVECIKDCPSGWHTSGPSRQYCYKYFSEKVVYNDAVKNCESINAVLVTPKTPEQNEKVASMRENKESIWIGLNDIENEGQFTWLDGEPQVKNENWGAWNYWEPNNVGGYEDCGQMFKDNQWSDAPCWFKFAYVCQVPVTSQT